jgi:hypothetical protein
LVISQQELPNSYNGTIFSLAVYLSGNVVSTGGSKITVNGNVILHCTLAMTVMKNANTNTSKTATIEVLCTSANSRSGLHHLASKIIVASEMHGRFFER